MAEHFAAIYSTIMSLVVSISCVSAYLNHNEIIMHDGELSDSIYGCQAMVIKRELQKHHSSDAYESNMHFVELTQVERANTLASSQCIMIIALILQLHGTMLLYMSQLPIKLQSIVAEEQQLVIRMQANAGIFFQIKEFYSKTEMEITFYALDQALAILMFR